MNAPGKPALGNLIRREPQRNGFYVNKRAFVAPDIFDLEMRTIFDRLWLYLGHVTEIPQPGDFVTRRVAGRPLLLVRGADGAVRALLNTCLHNGSVVCREAFGNRATFNCAYHGWAYDNRGQLIEVPGETAFGSRFAKADNGLVSVPSLAIFEGFVFVSFAERDDLEEFLAGAADYLRLLNLTSAAGMQILPGSHLYSTRANWKMLPVNVIDGNHFLPTHVTYLHYLRDRGSDLRTPIRDFHENDLGNGHTLFEYEAAWGRPRAKPDPAWGEAINTLVERQRQEMIDRLGFETGDRLARRNRNLVIFPNLIVNDIVGVTIRVCEPLAPDYMEVSAWELCAADDPPELAAVRNENFLTFLGPGGFATPDDIEGMESSQRGFAAYREVPWVNYSKGIEQELRGGRADPGQSDFMMRAYFSAWLDYLGVAA